MAKITRKTALIFGSSASAGDIRQFGSLAAGSPVTTTDPDTIQALANWLTGWLGAVIGGNSPTIEDMNAMCYVFAYQLAYLMQAGVAEWDSTTTYYIGSLVNDGAGSVYYSLTDSNLNNSIPNVTYWKKISGNPNVVSGSSNRTVGINDGLIRVSATHTETMPAAAGVIGQVFTFKKTDSNATTVTIAFNGAETCDGASTLSLVEQYSFYSLQARTSGYDIVSAG